MPIQSANANQNFKNSGIRNWTLFKVHAGQMLPEVVPSDAAHIFEPLHVISNNVVL